MWFFHVSPLGLPSQVPVITVGWSPAARGSSAGVSIVPASMAFVASQLWDLFDAWPREPPQTLWASEASAVDRNNSGLAIVLSVKWNSDYWEQLGNSSLWRVQRVSRTQDCSRHRSSLGVLPLNLWALCPGGTRTVKSIISVSKTWLPLGFFPHFFFSSESGTHGLACTGKSTLPPSYIPSCFLLLSKLWSHVLWWLHEMHLDSFVLMAPSLSSSKKT